MSLSRLAQLQEQESERITNAKRTIATDHAYIHEGIFFESFLKFTLGAGASKVISFQTPATGYIHYRMEKVSCSADKLTIALREGATINVDGSAITAFNHNRNSSKTASSVLKNAPTVTVAGTQIAQAYIGGGTGVGGSRSGSDTKADNEWVLKQNTVYTITFTNDSSGDNVVNVNNVWYEETST